MRSRKIFKRRGQALVLYALLLPLLFLFVGLGIDLGWYFINVSRLQNAADAAALAGAQALVKQEDFNNYLVISMASNKLPADFDDYADAYTNTFDSTTIASGKLYNYKHIEDIADALKEGRKSAEEYTRKNLADSTAVDESSNNTDTFTLTDGWSISKSAAGKTVSGKIELKYKIVDGKKDVYGPLYYVVNLTEKIRHLFMPGWFDPMEAPVKAVVLLKPHYKGLIEPMQQLERTKVIDNWEYTNRYRGTVGAYEGKWNHYQAGIRNNDKYGIKYTNGNVYRTESVIVTPSDKNNSVNKNTEANGGKFYTESEVDSINIDFRAEVEKTFTTDWDIGQPLSAQQKYHFTEGWSATDGADKRILFNAEFNEAFKKRESVSGTDPLWVRIESDPIIRQLRRDGKYAASYNSVRQVTLNFNKKNTDVANGEYKYRPYVIFYTGPENIDYTTTKDEYGNDVLIRHSQPVVLNLNEDLNAIIYMPNSPVIINGNGHAMHGFVIAKCYLQTVTREDMIGNNSITLYDGFNYNPKKPLECGFDEFTDGNGNTIYLYQDKLITRENVNAAHKTDATITEDANGNLTVKEKIDAPQYPIISFTKDLYTNCTTLAEYFDATANYINSTYTKEKYMAFSGLSASQVSMIKFPDETFEGKYHNFTDITIPVATADLSDSDPDPNADVKNDKYVKVMLLVESTSDGSESTGDSSESSGDSSESTGDSSEPQYVEKYIAKSKLPHMRIKRNANYPYVCLYDLKTGVDNNYNSVFATVKPTDDSITAPSDQNDNSAVVFLNGGKDTWAINRDLLTSMYDKEYIASKLTFVTADGFRYFNRNSEINNDPQVVAEYRKVIVGKDAEDKEIVKYVKEDDNLYYMKVDNNKDAEGNVINYIITDENGNILTKPVTAPELRIPENVDSKAENEALKTNIGGTALYDYWNTYTREPNENRPREIPGDIGTTENGQYVGKSDYRKDEDYRIPIWERVYYKNTFNLSDDSYYSYFDIEELWRVNYTYLNIDEFNHTVNREPSDENSTYYWKVADMFFTMVRAGWID